MFAYNPQFVTVCCAFQAVRYIYVYIIVSVIYLLSNVNYDSLTILGLAHSRDSNLFWCIGVVCATVTLHERSMVIFYGYLPSFSYTSTQWRLFSIIGWPTLKKDLKKEYPMVYQKRLRHLITIANSSQRKSKAWYFACKARDIMAY